MKLPCRPIGLAGLVLAACLAGGAGSLSAPPHVLDTALAEVPLLPNVLLVSLDTFRADFVKEARFLSDLAKQGRSFTTVYASSNWTLPSHVSLFTSLPYFEHNVPAPGLPGPFAGQRVSSSQPTLASTLRRAGFATAASTEGGFVGRGHGLDEGFDRFTSFPSRAAGAPDALEKHVAFAERFLGEKPNRPHFLFVHTYVVHDYFLNTKEYHRLLEAEDAPYAKYGNLIERQNGDVQPPPAFVRRLYTAGVHDADAFLRKLVRRVREKTADAPLLVIVTSDHGESLGERPGDWGHGSGLSDTQTRIPLIVWSNFDTALRGRENTPVSTIDVAPSLLRWLGLSVPSMFRGRDSLLQPNPGAAEVPLLVRAHSGSADPHHARIRQALIWRGMKYLRTDRYDGTTESERCHPIPEAPDEEPKESGPMKPECAHFRWRFARLQRSVPRQAFRLDSKQLLKIQCYTDSPLLAVQSAFPSAQAILSPQNGVLSWTPVAERSWLVGYPPSGDLRLSSLAVAGRSLLEDVRLADMENVVLRSKQRPDGFTARVRGLQAVQEAAPTVDPASIERLRALGYGSD